MTSIAGRTMIKIARLPGLLNTTSIVCQQSRSMRLYRERTMRAMYWRSRQFDAIKYPERHRSEFQDWNYKSEIFAFSRRLQENLSEDTLRRVFAHESYLESLRDRQRELSLPEINLESNAKLISRGEQLLDHCIPPYLRHTFNKMPEEGIVAITNYLKSEPVMADIAKSIGCTDIILCAERFPNEKTLAATMRAVLAGIDLDLGLDRVQRFVVDMIITYINEKDILDDIWLIPNPKQTLNLILKNSQLPNYEPRIMYQVGRKTLEQCFVVGIYVNHKLLGSSPGETIEIAEECAALDTLRWLFDLHDSRAPYVWGEASEKINYEAHRKEHPRISRWSFELQ